MPRYTYAGNFDSSDLRFTVGGQLKFDQPITFNIGGTTVAPDAEIIMPSFAGKSFYGKAGVSWIIPGAASGFKEFQIRGGVNYMHDDARTMATPEISATAKTDFIGKETDVTAQYLPNAVSGQLRFGVGVHW